MAIHDAEIPSCATFTQGPFPDVALSGRRAKEYLVLKATADSLASLDFQCAVRTTTRRTEQLGELRFDRVLDLVAWRKGSQPTHTIVVAISYNATAPSNAVVGNLWPVAITLEALRALDEAESLRNDIVVTISSTAEWGVLQSALRASTADFPLSDRSVTQINVYDNAPLVTPLALFDAPGWLIGVVANTAHRMPLVFPVVHGTDPATFSCDQPARSSSEELFPVVLRVVHSVRLDVNESQRASLSALGNRFFAALRCANGASAAALQDGVPNGEHRAWLFNTIAPIALLFFALWVVTARSRIRLDRAARAQERMRTWITTSRRLYKWHYYCQTSYGTSRRVSRESGGGGILTGRRRIGHFLSAGAAGVTVLLIRVLSFPSQYLDATRSLRVRSDLKELERLMGSLKEDQRRVRKRGIDLLRAAANSMWGQVADKSGVGWIFLGALSILLMAAFLWQVAGSLTVSGAVATVLLLIILALGIREDKSEGASRTFIIGGAMVLYSGLSRLASGPLAESSIIHLGDTGTLSTMFLGLAVILALCQFVEEVGNNRAMRAKDNQMSTDPVIGQVAAARPIVLQAEQLALQSWSPVARAMALWGRYWRRTIPLSLVVILYGGLAVAFVDPGAVDVWANAGWLREGGVAAVLATTITLLSLPVAALMAACWRRGIDCKAWILVISILAVGCDPVIEGAEAEVEVTDVQIEWLGSGDSWVVRWKTRGDSIEQRRTRNGGPIEGRPVASIERIGSVIAGDRRTVGLKIVRGLEGEMLRARWEDVNFRTMSLEGMPIGDLAEMREFQSWDGRGIPVASVEVELGRCDSVAVVVEEWRTGVDERLTEWLGPPPEGYVIGDSTDVVVGSRITLRQDWPLPSCCRQAARQSGDTLAGEGRLR